MSAQPLGLARSTIGVFQGLALYLLVRAADSSTWPATNGAVFAALSTLAVTVPVIIVVGLGRLRPVTLASWTAVAALVGAGVAVYSVLTYPNPAELTIRLLPGALAVIGLGVVLPLGHAITAAADADRKIIAAYPRYFDITTRLAIQIVLAVLFTAVFWGLLGLGAAMFELIKIEFITNLVKHNWFWIPLTSTLFCCGLHLGDRRAGMVTGIRTLALNLLSWLLPVMAGLSFAFLLALPFTGLAPLWATRAATAILLTAAGTLVILVNAAHQDGSPEARPSTVIQVAQDIAALALAPLVALAGYGLALRVQQHGWTPDRVIVLATIVVAGVIALGYAAAVARAPRNPKWIETTNEVAAAVVVVVLLALMSPLLDPARISVADQVARLRAGRVAADDFDYYFLRFDAGRPGIAALEGLAADPPGPQASQISERARQALQAQTRVYARKEPASVGPEQRAANITVTFPKGRSLPDDFLRRDWRSLSSEQRLRVPDCLIENTKCDALLLDLDNDGSEDVLLFSDHGARAAAFRRGHDGWSLLGSIANAQCHGVREALKAGEVKLVPPPALNEIEVAGQRLRIVPPSCE